MVSMAYWALSLVVGSWLLVRVTDVSSAMNYLQYNPLTAVATASALIFLAYRYNFVSGPIARYPTTRPATAPKPAGW